VENGKIVKEQYSLLETDPVKYSPDAQVLNVIKNSEQPYREEIASVIGYSKVPLYRYFVVENTIDTLIINALKWKVGTDIALSNGFRFCPPRNKRDKTGNIPITEGFLYDMLPVDSRVRTGKVSGAQLRTWLEKELNNVFAKEASQRLGGWIVKFKGMKIEFKAFAEAGNRIQAISINDNPVEPQAMYTICACEREGDAPTMLCRLMNVSEAENTPFHLHQVVKEYLQQHSPVSPLPERNAVILDAPQTLLTQVTGVDYVFT
jgi:S-sulfosulfanyl-L-cysteine sulfohydrolase